MVRSILHNLIDYKILTASQPTKKKKKKKYDDRHVRMLAPGAVTKGDVYVFWYARET